MCIHSEDQVAAMIDRSYALGMLAGLSERSAAQLESARRAAEKTIRDTNVVLKQKR